jgi:hypothetical protein
VGSIPITRSNPNTQETRIEIKGKRPDSLIHPERGDAAFLESFHRARAAHDRFQGDVMSRKVIEEQAQRIVEQLTTRTVKRDRARLLALSKKGN